MMPFNILPKHKKIIHKELKNFGTPRNAFSKSFYLLNEG